MIETSHKTNACGNVSIFPVLRMKDDTIKTTVCARKQHQITSYYYVSHIMYCRGYWSN